MRDYTDSRVAEIVMLEQAIRDLTALKNRLADDVKRDEELFHTVIREVDARRVLDAIRESDEWATGGPIPCHDIAPGFEGVSHSFAPRPEPAPMCYEAMDEVDETP